MLYGPEQNNPHIFRYNITGQNMSIFGHKVHVPNKKLPKRQNMTQPIRTILNRFGKSPDAKINRLRIEHHKLRLPSHSQFFSNSLNKQKETAFPLVSEDFREHRAHHLTVVETQTLAVK